MSSSSTNPMYSPNKRSHTPNAIIMFNFALPIWSPDSFSNISSHVILPLNKGSKIVSRVSKVDSISSRAPAGSYSSSELDIVMSVSGQERGIVKTKVSIAPSPHTCPSELSPYLFNVFSMST